MLWCIRMIIKFIINDGIKFNKFITDDQWWGMVGNDEWLMEWLMFRLINSVLETHSHTLAGDQIGPIGRIRMLF